MVIPGARPQCFPAAALQSAHTMSGNTYIEERAKIIEALPSVLTVPESNQKYDQAGHLLL